MSPKNLSASGRSLNLLKTRITDKNLKRIYEKFEQSLNLNKNFIVAVSGGSDSLALAYLTKIYSLKKKIKAIYFIVDHRIRTGSTKEANSVKKLLKKHKIKTEVLSWKGKKPSSNIQSIARAARYDLLFKKCNQFRINNILLGHHSDDLLENFLIRILRGSGLRGLASFDKKTLNNKINIIRPLINLEKKDLIYVSERIFKFYVTDPSNSDDKFQRIKIRKLLTSLQKEGLDKKKFLSTINNLKSSDDTIKYFVKENLEKNVVFFGSRKIAILNNNFFKNPNEIIFRSLSECIKKIGENYYFVRGKKLQKIIDDLSNKTLFKGTLGRCIIKKIDQTVIISREN